MRYLLVLLFAVVCQAAVGHCEIEVDLDGDGRPEKVRVEGKTLEGPLVAFSRKGNRRWQIDHHVVTRECYALTLFGRKGIAILPHGMALRFYTPTGAWGSPWTYIDLYSFYTASWQGGLIQADINGDGLPDLFCGNYWLESPKTFDLPWRLYAINAFHETPVSATAQLHWDGKRLLWVESRSQRGRVVWFTPPKDIHQLWTPSPHPLNGRLDCPQLKLRNGQPVITAAKKRRLANPSINN